jgi:hypothetical protein
MNPRAVQVFEWYHPWQNIAPSLTQYMDPVSCATSTLQYLHNFMRY